MHPVRTRARSNCREVVAGFSLRSSESQAKACDYDRKFRKLFWRSVLGKGSDPFSDSLYDEANLRVGSGPLSAPFHPWRRPHLGGNELLCRRLGGIAPWAGL